jgi:hypothetical protein
MWRGRWIGEEVFIIHIAKRLMVLRPAMNQLAKRGSLARVLIVAPPPAMISLYAVEILPSRSGGRRVIVHLAAFKKSRAQDSMGLVWRAWDAGDL